MYKVKYRIEGQEVQPPLEGEDMGIALNFTDEEKDAQVSINSFTFTGDTYRLLRNVILDGTVGGKGIFQGLDINVSFENAPTIVNFDLLADLRKAEVNGFEEKITVPTVVKAGIDWTNEHADGFSLQTLWDRGLITKDNLVFMPYVINSVPNYKEAFIVILTIASIEIQIKQVIEKIKGESINALTIIDSIGAVINLIFTIIYVIALVVAIVKLLIKLVLLIIQPVKYMAGMYVNDILEIGARFLGLSYESSILQNGLYRKAVIFPKTYGLPSNSTEPSIKGFTNKAQSDQTGLFEGTFGDVLRDINTTINSRVDVKDGVMKVVPKLFIPTGASFTLLDYSQDEYTMNAPDVISNFNFKFTVDTNDKNTVESWTGTNADIHTEPANIVYRQKLLLAGARNVQFPFSRATSKKELTDPEKFVSELLKGLSPILNLLRTVANGVIEVVKLVKETILDTVVRIINLFAKENIDIPPNPQKIKPIDTDIIENRLGMLVLENDSINVNKLVIVDEATNERYTKINPENDTFLSAKAIYERHFTDVNTQFFFRKFDNVKMTIKDVKDIMDEGAVKLADGKPVKVRTLEYNAFNQVAQIEIAEQLNYDNDLTIDIHEPKGR